MKREKTRGLSIRTKILVPTSILIVLLCVVMGVSSYLHTRDGLVAMGVEEARMAAIISVKVINGDELEKAVQGGRTERGISGIGSFHEQCT